MCVKIIKNSEAVMYDMEQPLAQQLDGSEEVVVNFQENDPSVHHFMDAVEEYSKTAFGHGLNIRVVHNNLVNGARAKKNALIATENMTFNDIIKMMALAYQDTDKKLSEIAEMCTGKNCDE